MESSKVRFPEYSNNRDSRIASCARKREPALFLAESNVENQIWELDKIPPTFGTTDSDQETG